MSFGFGVVDKRYNQHGERKEEKLWLVICDGVRLRI